MKSTSSRLAWTFLAACAIVAVPGCDSDNDLFTAPGQFSENAMATLNESVVIPTIEGLDLADDAFVTVKGLGEVPTGASCACPFDCRTGSCESGPAESGGSGCMLEFVGCNTFEGVRYHGTVEIVGTGSSGGMNFDVEIDGADVRGGVDYVQGKGCFSTYYGGLTIESAFGTVLQSGSLTWCPGSDYPTGEMYNLSVGSAGEFMVDVFHDGTASPMACVYETEDFGKGPEASTFLAECAVDMLTGAANCNFDELSLAQCGGRF